MSQSEISPDFLPDVAEEEPELEEMRLLLLIETMGQLEGQAAATAQALQELKRSATDQHGQLLEQLRAQRQSTETIVPQVEARLVQLAARASTAIGELLPERLATESPSEIGAARMLVQLEDLQRQLRSQLDQLEEMTSELASTQRSGGAESAVLERRLVAWTRQLEATLEELSRTGPSLARLELGLATTRSDLLTALSSPHAIAVASTNQELLDELRILWRKQELYVLGLQSGLKSDLELSHQQLRTRLREDLGTELKILPTALGSVVRQALTSPPRSVSPPAEPSEPARQPLVGVVILSSLTSALVTGAMLWCLV